MPEVPFPHYDYEWFKGFCKRIGIEVHTACNSLGTLGGGNHFIEIGVSENTGYWLTIHTGSRNLGLKVAKYWQDKAVNVTEQEHKERIATVLRETRDKTEIEQRIEWIKADYNGDKELMFLTGERMHGYLIDMLFAQQYAAENRNWILLAMKRALGFEYNDDINVWNTYKLMGRIESVHNYIDFHDMIIRKGAIKSEYLMIIPFNMRDGLLICKGKDNPDWNFSAPHGAGRLMGRGEAKRKLDMQEFTEQMGGIVSSSVCEGTLDEAPSAYKSAALIESLIEPTVTIVDRVKPVLNIKSL
jgi:RNA-splicing ligase RtcB